MQHLTRLEMMQRALRGRICPDCLNRPSGSESLGPNQPRSCEPECTIFMNRPVLMQIAEQVDDPSIGPYERVVTELVCQTCQSSPTAGDYCAERTALMCPRRRYMFDIIDALESVPAK